MSDLFDYSFGPQSPTDAALARGRLLVEASRPADAVSFLQQAIAADPGRFEAWCLLSQAQLEVGEFSEALGTARRAAAVAPGQEWPHRLQALALLSLGNAQNALKAAQVAESLAPEEPNVLHTLGRCCLDAGRKFQSRAVARRLLALVPEWFCTYELLGLVALRERQWREAERHFREALRFAPEAWTAHNNLALALRAQRREAEAVEHFHAAARLNPRSELVLNNLETSVTSHVHGNWMMVLGLVSYFTLLMLSFQRSGAGADHRVADVLMGGGILVGIAAIATSRARRLGRLPSGIQACYRDRRRREWLVVSLAFAFIALCLACAFCWMKTLELSRFGPQRAGLFGEGLLWYLLSCGVVVVALGALVVRIRKELAERVLLKTRTEIGGPL